MKLNINEPRLVQGGFKFYDTHGMPLDMVIDFFENRGLRLDLHDFAKDAKKAGWSFKKTKNTILNGLSDAGLKIDFDLEKEIEKVFIGEISNEV